MDSLDHLSAVFPEDVAKKVMCFSVEHPLASIFKQRRLAGAQIRKHDAAYMECRRLVREDLLGEPDSDYDESDEDNDDWSDEEIHEESEDEHDWKYDDEETMTLIYDRYVKYLVSLYKDGVYINDTYLAEG